MNVENDEKLTIKVQRDCILYKSENVCAGLKQMYCKKENCNFYKNRKEYNKYGSKINNLDNVKEK